jgi:hypothetical protein
MVAHANQSATVSPPPIPSVQPHKHEDHEGHDYNYEPSLGHCYCHTCEVRLG